MTEFSPMGPGDDLRTFVVRRMGDVSGTSGVGDVAKGVVFPDGATVVQWQSRARSIVVFKSYVDALYIHGHGDQTGFVFDADPDTIYFSDGSSKDMRKGFRCPCGQLWDDEVDWREHHAEAGCGE